MSDSESSVSIRPAVRADLPAIETMLASNELPTSGVAESLDGFFVAEVHGALVGSVGVEYRGVYGLLRSTAVAPGWRGRGVGRQLVERVVAEAKRRGVETLFLLTTTAEGYFPSFGFEVSTRAAVPEEIRATGEFRGACPESATVMRLALGAG